MKPTQASSTGGQRRLRIRITKTLPAPMMDGFNVRGLCAEHVYDLDPRTGNYLIVAGYAVKIDNPDSEHEERRRG